MVGLGWVSWHMVHKCATWYTEEGARFQCGIETWVLRFRVDGGWGCFGGGFVCVDGCMDGCYHAQCGGYLLVEHVSTYVVACL
ncbi:hypothetical protein T440DRAFT_111301 [Plenodomus tracheiphilus IPT5]|uniref:Uncharacterized protein n=1 Tax=Plenodomus tracheiphilus IPT5 TaxID=1408161 RepID=A0A6A7B7I9_9PLEO|nr:hypothetical protein T440DRAFT_111301 [Plenodomus tracheiphilus IPT5]